MVLDIIAIILIIVFFIRGYMKGLIVAAFSILAIILGVFCALKLSERLASYMLEQGWVTSGWSQIISYIVLFVGVMLLVRLIARAIESALKAAMLGWINKTLGGVLYMGIAVLVWSTFLWLGREIGVISPELIKESKTYAYIEPVAPWLADKVGMLVPMVKEVFADLEFFFDSVNTYIPTDVDTAR